MLALITGAGCVLTLTRLVCRPSFAFCRPVRKFFSPLFSYVENKEGFLVCLTFIQFLGFCVFLFLFLICSLKM
jgi:hypothetical protein